MTQKTLGKIEKLTGVPDANSEYLQLLKYEKGQFYRVHHDYIGNDDERPVDSPGTHQVSPQAGDGKDRLDGLTLPQVSPSATAYKSPKQGAMKGDSSRSAAKTRSVVLEDLPRLDSVLRNDAYLPTNLVSPHRGAGVAAGARANPAAAYLDAYAFRQTERSRYSPYTRRIRACLR